jgi:tRNA nucleotidyltransferase/poly(A) polymerase
LNAHVLNTFFDANASVAANPLIILRALKYACRYEGFTIDPSLQQAMKANIDKLPELGEDRIAKGISDILREGKVRGEQLLAEYGVRLTEFRIGTNEYPTKT